MICHDLKEVLFHLSCCLPTKSTCVVLVQAGSLEVEAVPVPKPAAKNRYMKLSSCSVSL